MGALRRVAYLLLCLVFPIGITFAADGYFDPTWAGGGRITLAPCNDVAGVYRVVVEDGGNILLGGPCATTAGSQTWWLGELSPAGVPVVAFGGFGNGLVTGCPLSSGLCSSEYFEDMSIRPDGRIAFATQRSVGRVVAKAYMLDIANVAGGNGVPPANGAGFVHANAIPINTNAGGYFARPRAVAHTGDGKLLLAGYGLYSASSSTSDMAVVRLNSDLSLDTSFNNATDGNGIHFAGGRTIDFSGSNDDATGILVQADGRILLVGNANAGASPAVVRLNADGSLDTTFGGGTGKTILSWSGGTLDASSSFTLTNAGIRLDRAGRILLAVHAKVHSGNKDYWGMAAIRLLADGSVDSSFGSGQVAFRPVADFCTGARGANAHALALDSAGRILLAGECAVSDTKTNFIVMRIFGDTGGLDTSFGISGRSYGVFADPDTDDAVYDIAFDKSGRPIIGGRSYKFGNSFDKGGVGRLTYDLIFTNDLETVPRGRLSGQ